MRKLFLVFSFLIVLVIFPALSFAQDAVKVDPDNYKVEFENDQVRVLRISLDPGEKGIMHSHPDGVVVFLNDGEGKFTFPDGKTRESKFKSGQVIWAPAITHKGENTGKKSFEVIQIEFKKNN
ncbi:MAG: cupin domain-containing protein [Ignavibacterium album]|jgi:quercetin dioxygenase-like cupin family protein|uniref:Cupin domain-containing protein n=1 Tax=Ignavibacterium album TaxID=591197 RepID=A0A7V2ZI38_9BACT|nr:cupin domain-containing protein [Ignavibacterium album]MCX8105006.1 cupin domain-containing protein [Ignavibacterium album]